MHLGGDRNADGRVDIEVRKEVKIRKRYNQIPHLTQDITWESYKHTINITNKRSAHSQQVTTRQQ